MEIKILMLAANPKDTTRLRLDQEVREIEHGLQRAKHREQFEIKAQWAVRIQDLRRAMLDFCPNIVHFSGHGKREAGITFENDRGESQLVNAEALAGFFKLFAEYTQCVVLNACYSEVQARAISEHIPFVIGMSDVINDSVALEFAVAFYDALGAGRTVDFAYELACNAILMAGIEKHVIPVLYAKKSEDNGKEMSSDQHGVPKHPQSIQVEKKESPPNLRNQVVEFLASLPNIQDKNERRALIFSAGLDQALVDQLVFEGPTSQFFPLLVQTCVGYGRQQDGRDPLIAILEAAKQKVGQEKKILCERLLQLMRKGSQEDREQKDVERGSDIDVRLRKINDVDEVTGIETDTRPEGSTKVTIEDVKKGKKVTGMTIKKV